MPSPRFLLLRWEFVPLIAGWDGLAQRGECSGARHSRYMSVFRDSRTGDQGGFSEDNGLAMAPRFPVRELTGKCSEIAYWARPEICRAEGRRIVGFR